MKRGLSRTAAILAAIVLGALLPQAHTAAWLIRWLVIGMLFVVFLQTRFSRESLHRSHVFLLAANLAIAAAAWGDSPVGRGVLKTLLTAGDEPDVRALVVRWMRTRAKGPRALFARAIARGELDEKADVEMAMNVVAGAISHRILVQSQSVTPVFVNRLIRLVLDGLTANGA